MKNQNRNKNEISYLLIDINDALKYNLEFEFLNEIKSELLGRESFLTEEETNESLDFYLDFKINEKDKRKAKYKSLQNMTYKLIKRYGSLEDIMNQDEN